ncbi:DUF2857 domain-containing protein [Pseudomonas rhodesiae]|uniref:DUF2857 domain-containing protein n=1 Tax=Pseudomonas rhodesiae TaxID=76760 RepID=UPI001BD12E0B|nr:DUF2857 domain-containing protein [Pseudomonas rhodesiae]QVN05602.1 DUF2857 domain-containing protein [Pseudomonas rhodesiae]
MLIPHPLNQAMIAQALQNMHNGQFRRCQAMGFSASMIAALKQPEKVSLLVHAQVCWCTVTVNQEVVDRLLLQTDESALNIANVNRMLRLGANVEMIRRVSGLTPRKIKVRRDALGLPAHKGRYSELNSKQIAELRRYWRTQLQPCDIEFDDQHSLIFASLDIAEKLGHPASVVWRTVEKLFGVRS